MKIRAKTRGSLGGDAVYCAAYRGGRRLWNERTGDLYKHDGRQDVRDVGIVLPQELARDPAMEWARDPYKLWNAAEFSEVNRNARVAREYMVILPEEMTFEQRRDVVYGFAQTLADRYGNAIDVALHDRRTGRARHFHAHLLATTRKIGREGLLEKTDAEVSWRFKSAESPQKVSWHESSHVRTLWVHSLRSAIHEAGLAPETYDRLHREFGQGESARAYRHRLHREGFDLRRQQREDRRKTALTAQERRESAQKKWAIRKFRHLQKDARAERQAQAQRDRKAGHRTPADKRHLRCWIPRWDVTKGVLNPWEVETHLRRVGQTPGMVPWLDRENPGPEPQFEPDPEPSLHHEPPRAGPPSDPAMTGIERWLAMRAAQPDLSEAELRQRAIERWLAQRNAPEQHRSSTAQQQAEVERSRESAYDLGMG